MNEPKEPKMSKPQLVLEESLECYLKRIQHGQDHTKTTDALIDFSFELLIGLKAAHGKILITEEK